MQVVRRPDAYDVEVVTGDEILPASVQVGYAVALPELVQLVLFEAGERDGFYAGHPHEVLQVLLAGVAEADHPGAQGFYGRCF